MATARTFRVVWYLIGLTMCLGGTVEDGAGATFEDVSSSYWSFVPIETLAASGITRGCSATPPLFCPEMPVLRSEMAVFLERSMKGSSFEPPPAGGIFADVPPGYWASAWIEQIFYDGITGGCSASPLLYCPERSITRAEISVLILKSIKGRDFIPPPGAGIFADVPASYWAAPWIEELYRQKITSGCSNNPLKFCPDSTASRAEMAALLVRAFEFPLVAQQSVNSTSKNRDGIPFSAVVEQPFTGLSGFQMLANNDLGMHCGDLDHRTASILPPFNVLHAQVIAKGAKPQILNDSAVEVYYSAASNPKDPALQKSIPSSIFKTNFWEPNPATGNLLAFDAYDPFYPPGILQMVPLYTDVGLPVPDVARLYLGDQELVADQQDMPGVANPYGDNTPQRFTRFDTMFPFFIDFPSFGYTLSGLNWFAADGIPFTPFDDFGRSNSYPLVRVQAKDKAGGLTGSAGSVLASVDTVLPVSAEADCYRCHTSSADGGNGEAACIPGIDGNCATGGGRRTGTAFRVATASEDTANVPAGVSREWAADLNIIRLHDARHGTSLQAQTPVVCQRCHYTPALDLAQVGPLGPGETAANGREQRIHRSNSRVLHSYHSQFTDLFDPDMPPPTDANRFDSVTGKPQINAFVQDKLFRSCYQCHPGKNTNCLRGAMFNGGLVCQDCHGSMAQVGDDFSINLSSATPFPSGADLSRRIPWAHEPGCQSCHTGDVLNNLAADPNVIPARDGVRLLRAYQSNDPNARPIVATNRRFAENEIGGKQVLYRLSKDNHAGVYCEACHGSTHAEWPVQPEQGSYVANDNMTALQLQGHTGVLIECTACHTAGSLPVSLNGPHGLHPIGDSRWVSGHEGFLEGQSLDTCRTCHGARGEGTVLAKVRADRTLNAEESRVNLVKGSLVSCGICHRNPM
jgi:hypothetical protein